MSDTKQSTTEVTKSWTDLSKVETECCLAAHCVPLGLSFKNQRHMQTLHRIFDLGRPKIVLVLSDGKPKAVRVHEESADVIKLLIRQYL